MIYMRNKTRTTPRELKYEYAETSQMELTNRWNIYRIFGNFSTAHERRHRQTL